MSKQIQTLRDRLEPGVTPADLTERQARVLSYVLQCWLSGFLPTVREICSELGYNSTNAAAGHLAAIKRAGYFLDEEAASGLILSDKALELVL